MAASHVSSKLLSLGQQTRLFYGYPLADEEKQKSAELYQDKAASFWDTFYKANGNRFFKDRHWITREFPELLTFTSSSEDSSQPAILDVGGGVGNTLFPVDGATDKRYRWVSFDLSKKAIELVHLHPLFDAERHTAFVFDFVSDAAWPTLPSLTFANEFQFAVLFFVLSAVAPSLHAKGLKRLFDALRPGGMLLFRDYQQADHAQSRFEEAGNNQISTNFFVRKDGTQAYFFSADELTALAQAVGFQVVRVGSVKRDLTNHKEELELKEKRVFLQAVLVKPNDQ